MIKAEVIADSATEHGHRITTMIVTMPRFILAEFNTHRMFSRNSASSRAIPFDKMVKSVEENPFIPLAWQKDHKGMQGNDYVTNVDVINYRNGQWLKICKNTIRNASEMHEELIRWTGPAKSELHPDGEPVTKQMCNRLLEPFMYHTVIVTATEWENFFALRCPMYEIIDKVEEKEYKTHYRSRKEWLDQVSIRKTDYNVVPANETEWLRINKGQAEIHMMATAEAMWDAYNSHLPHKRRSGEWHIPFAEKMDQRAIEKVISASEFTSLPEDDKLYLKTMIKISTAMCARTSYTVVGSENAQHDAMEDIKLHDRLAASGHWSPFEHCAQAVDAGQRMGGNFIGWHQYRKMFANENIQRQ